MNTSPIKRITIVGASSLQEALVKELHQLGATGYTYTVVHGAGARGVRPSAWTGPNGKIEVIAPEDVAERILEHISQKYFDQYPVIAYVDEVEVLRPEKFS